MDSTYANRSLKRFVVVLVLAAAVVSATQASSSAGQKYGQFDPWMYPVLGHIEQAATNWGPPDAPFASAIRAHARRVTTSTDASLPVVGDAGFDWADAGVGAGVAFTATCLVGGIGIALVRRTRSGFAGL